MALEQHARESGCSLIFDPDAAVAHMSKDNPTRMERAIIDVVRISRIDAGRKDSGGDHAAGTRGQCDDSRRLVRCRIAVAASRRGLSPDCV